MGVKRSTRAMATATTRTTTKAVSLTVVIVVSRVWAVQSRRLTAKSANALIRTPYTKMLVLTPKRLRAVRRSTRAMATATTITTTKDASTTAAIAVPRAWAVL